jgi:hypothetical protein
VDEYAAKVKKQIAAGDGSDRVQEPDRAATG